VNNFENIKPLINNLWENRGDNSIINFCRILNTFIVKDETCLINLQFLLEVCLKINSNYLRGLVKSE